MEKNISEKTSLYSGTKIRFFIAFLILIISIVAIKKYKEKNRYNELTILFDNEFIELINEPIIDDNKNILDMHKISQKNLPYFTFSLQNSDKIILNLS